MLALIRGCQALVGAVNESPEGWMSSECICKLQAAEASKSGFNFAFKNAEQKASNFKEQTNCSSRESEAQQILLLLSISHEADEQPEKSGGV